MPIHYHLIFRNNLIGGYDVFEKHTCTLKGCLWTSPEYTGRTCLPGNESEFIHEYNEMLKEQDGVVVSYNVVGWMEVE